MKSDSSKDSSGITTREVAVSATSSTSKGSKDSISVNVVKSNGHFELYQGKRLEVDKIKIGVLRIDPNSTKIVVASQSLAKKIIRLRSLNEAPLPEEEERGFLEKIVKEELEIEQVA